MIALFLRLMSTAYQWMYVFYRRIDKDKNGSISGDELQQALANGML